MKVIGFSLVAALLLIPSLANPLLERRERRLAGRHLQPWKIASLDGEQEDMNIQRVKRDFGMGGMDFSQILSMGKMAITGMVEDAQIAAQEAKENGEDPQQAASKSMMTGLFDNLEMVKGMLGGAAKEEAEEETETKEE